MLLLAQQGYKVPQIARIVLRSEDTVADLDCVRRQQVGGGYPPDMLVCYVGLSGTFTVGGPYGASTASSVSIVFDAHTGNEIVFVGGPLLG